MGKTPLDLALAILQTKQDVDWDLVVGTVLGLDFEDVEEQIPDVAQNVEELKVLAADKEEIKELELTKEQDVEEVIAADVEVIEMELDMARQRNECRSS